MNNKIHKHTFVKYETKHVVHLPFMAEVLTVKKQGNNICLWFSFDIRNVTEEIRVFEFFETGEEILDFEDYKYITTLLFRDDTYVLHIFENTKEREQL